MRVLFTPANKGRNEFIGLISEKNPRFTYCIDGNHQVWAYPIQYVVAVGQDYFTIKSDVVQFIVKCENEDILNFLERRMYEKRPLSR